VKSRDWPFPINSVEPHAVADYLANRGWRKRGKGFPGVETWARGRAGAKGSAAIVLPTERSLVDFPALLERAFAEVAEFEGRAVEDLIVDVVAPSSAVLRVGVEVEPDPDGGIPLNLASALMDTLRRATSAAAERAALASAGPDPWQANAVRRYLERVRFEHTEPGSYVMKALLPDRLADDERAAATPRVPTILVEDLQRLENVAVAGDGEAGDGRQMWDWPFGLDVIHALARLYEPSVLATFIELELPHRGERVRPAQQFRFDRDALAQFENLGEALPERLAVAREARRLRRPIMGAEEVVVFANVVLEGDVVRLARPEITIETLIDGERKRMRVPRVVTELDALAHEAQGRHSRVRVVGTLVLRGAQASLRDVVGIDLLSEG
jgi:hypothetical protein